LKKTDSYRKYASAGLSHHRR